MISTALQSKGVQAVGGKRKRETDEAGESAALVREFLQDFAALPLEAMAPEEALAQTQSLLSRVEERQDDLPTLKRLLAAH